MVKRDEKAKNKYYWNAHMSSGGTLNLRLHFPDGVTKDEKEQALADGIAQSHKYMLSKGYLLPRSRFMSPKDLSTQYGHSRQYWEKLLKEGKIPYKETSAGMITTDMWVEGYLNNKEAVDEYVRNCKRVLRSIHENGNRRSAVICPSCKEERFEYSLNTHNTNGICRACGFHLNTVT